jgi:N-acylneuraminate cytidylyltransferase
MKTATVILARGGSKGIPRKNIIDFAGKPLLAHSIEQAKASEYGNKVYVSSDDEEILTVAKDYGANLILRPEILAQDTSSSETALLHAINEIDDIDTVVFLQPTSPLREPKDIDNAIETLVNNSLDSVFSAVEAKDLCLWTCNRAGTPRSLNTLNFNFENRKRRQELSGQLIENGSIYVFRTRTINRYNNRLGGNIGYSLMDNWKVHEIDDMDDLRMCEFIYKFKELG